MKIEDLLRSERSQEARTWLEGGPPGSRTLGEAGDPEESRELVEELYRLGAERVTAVDIMQYESGEENTGTLVITLPDDPVRRAALFARCGELAREQGFDPEDDLGQKHLLVMLD
ncbi:MAG: hypothetical protein NZM29_04510 [Nitrospira sp.]|nr:hypothetical protein [Nitrospira sp.]